MFTFRQTGVLLQHVQLTIPEIHGLLRIRVRRFVKPQDSFAKICVDVHMSIFPGGGSSAFTGGTSFSPPALVLLIYSFTLPRPALILSLTQVTLLMGKVCDNPSLRLAVFVLCASLYNFHELCVLSAVHAYVCTFIHCS